MNKSQILLTARRCWRKRPLASMLIWDSDSSLAKLSWMVLHWLIYILGLNISSNYLSFILRKALPFIFHLLIVIKVTGWGFLMDVWVRLHDRSDSSLPPAERIRASLDDDLPFSVVTLLRMWDEHHVSMSFLKKVLGMKKKTMQPQTYLEVAALVRSAVHVCRCLAGLSTPSRRDICWTQRRGQRSTAGRPVRPECPRFWNVHTDGWINR